ncbi:hypothetical protein X943_003798 [Babesia divergens]|uniref:Uncharacterized protein n=1 Tax=Babesia divergens TaxID=32595 RepID=A0AAD9LIA0_BABDI|nr:hypothetical protein X943_003798 [Babesia divergens]
MEETEVQQGLPSDLPQTSLTPFSIVKKELTSTSEESTLHLADLKGDDNIPGASAQRKASDDLMSIASIETQPPINYHQFNKVYQPTEYAYEPEKQFGGYGAYYQNCYGLDSSWPYTCPTSIDNTQVSNQSLTVDLQQSHYAGGVKKSIKYEQDNQGKAPAMEQRDYQKQEQVVVNSTNPIDCAPKKVVAVNPVILVDKVERSLIVRWYENGIRREQRISYKKYGNAKAQERAEILISKLLAGSTFDQLYPEKGPPILTIFENAGEYKVSLTRDRTLREWRVDWVNNNGTKMRARWSCKKVGNEEAKKRAEAFANSLLQGKFNLRLLHKATGTRLSRNDMKYNTVLNEFDYPKQHLFVADDAKERHGVSGEYREAPAKIRNTGNPDIVRKKTARATNRKKKARHEYFAGLGNPPMDYVHMPPDVSFPGFFPMYPEDCESSNSLLGRSYDSMPGCGDNLLAPNWQTWPSVAQNLDYGVGGEWDYGDPSLDYRRFNPMYDLPPTNFMNQMDWMSNSCMMKYMPTGVDAPMSTAELNEEPHHDIQHPNGPFYPYYHQEASLCYPDSTATQDQLGLSGSYFDLDFMNGDNQNTQSQCSYMSPQWTQPEANVAECNQGLQSAMTLTTDTTVVSSSTHPKDGAHQKLDGDVMNAQRELEQQPTMVTGMPLWPTFGNMQMNEMPMNNMKLPQEYNIATLPTTYANDSFEYLASKAMEAANCDDGSKDCFKDRHQMSETHGFYTSANMQ